MTETRPRRRLRGSWWSIPLILAAAIWASALDFSTIRAWSDLMNSTHSSTEVYIDATSWNELKGSNRDRLPSFGPSCLANAIVAIPNSASVHCDGSSGAKAEAVGGDMWKPNQAFWDASLRAPWKNQGVVMAAAAAPLIEIGWMEKRPEGQVISPEGMVFFYLLANRVVSVSHSLPAHRNDHPKFDFTCTAEAAGQIKEAALAVTTTDLQLVIITHTFWRKATAERREKPRKAGRRRRGRGTGTPSCRMTSRNGRRLFLISVETRREGVGSYYRGLCRNS